MHANWDALNHRLSTYKNINLDTADKNGNYSVSYLKIKILVIRTRLLEKFANLGHKNRNGQRPIHFVCNITPNNHGVLFKYLVDRDIELNCADKDGWNPIHYLCEYSPNVSLISYLLTKKINLECKTNKGMKPVHSIAKQL